MGRPWQSQRASSTYATSVRLWLLPLLLVAGLRLASAEEAPGRTRDKPRNLMGCTPPNGTLPASVHSSLRSTSYPVSPSVKTSARGFSNTGRRALIPLSYSRIPALAPLSGLATGVASVPAYPAVSAAPATALYSTGVAPTAASMTTAMDPRTSWEASTAQLSSRNAVLQDRIVAAALAAQAAASAAGAANSGTPTVQGPLAPMALSLPLSGQAATPQVTAPVVASLPSAGSSIITAPATSSLSSGVASLGATAALPSTLVSQAPATFPVAAAGQASFPAASTTTVVTPPPIISPSLAVSANIPSVSVTAPAATSGTYSASLPVVAPVAAGQQATTAELESDTVVVKHQPTVYKPPPTVVQPPPTVIHHPPTVVEHPSTVIEPAATIISSKHTASHTGSAVVHNQGEQASVYSAGTPAVAMGGTAPSLVSTGAAQLQAVGGVSAYTIPSARSSTVSQKVVSSTSMNPVVASSGPVAPLASAVTQPVGLSTLGGSTGLGMVAR